MSNVVALKRNNDVIIDFIDSFKSENTKVNYSIDLCDFFEVKDVEYISEMMIKKVKFIDVQNYIQRLVRENKSNSTIKRRIGSLRSLFNYCMSRQVVNHNIFADPQIKRIMLNNMDKEEEFIGKSLNKEEIRQYLGSIKKKRDIVLFKVLFATGVRREELVNIKGTNFIYNEREGSWYLQVYGKGRKHRKVELSKQILKALIDWKGREFYKIDEYFFPMDVSNVNKLCKKYSRLSGIEVSPHDCRRTFAVELSNNGIDTRKIQLILGHENIQTTELYLKTQVLLDQGLKEVEMW